MDPIDTQYGASYDQTIIDDPMWFSIKKAAEYHQVGDRQLRNIAKKNAWVRKYAKVNGKPAVFYAKESVLSHKGPFTDSGEESIAARHDFNDDLPESTIEITPRAAQTQHTDPIQPEQPGTKPENPADFSMAIYEKQLANMHALYEERISEIKASNQDKLTDYRNTIKSRTVGFYMALGTTIIISIALGFILVLTHRDNSALTRTNNELTKEVIGIQKQLGTLQNELFQKDTLIKMQTNSQDVSQK